MASTPEGKVKEKVKGALKALIKSGHPLYFHMPVQNGMGEPTLDFVGCAKGRAFAIEAKAPGKKPTARQLLTIEKMEKSGMAVFVFDGRDVLGFSTWLAKLFT